MKPFSINRNSWHYKLNTRFMNSYSDSRYGIEDGWEPRVNNFCAYWRATVTRVVLLFILAIIGTFFAATLAAVLYTHPLEILTSILIIVGVIFTAVVIGLSWDHIAHRERSEPRSLIGKKIYAAKRSICPTVEYSDE